MQREHRWCEITRGHKCRLKTLPLTEVSLKQFSFVSITFLLTFHFRKTAGGWLYLYILLLYDGLLSHLPLVDSNPISGGKPLVALDIIDSIPEVAEALGQVHLQQISQQILQV